MTQALEPSAGVAESEGRRTDGCQVARAAWKDAQSDLGWWRSLLLAVGFAAVATLVVLILQLTHLDTSKDAVEAAAAGLGVILSGAGTGFVRKRRKEAAAEARTWADLVDKRCKQ